MTHYMRLILATGEVSREPFTADHFSAAGFSSALGAMPILEAHQLVNKWNTSQREQEYVYAL